MTLSASRLDTRVRIERRASAIDDGEGNRLEAWATVATLWAGWRPEFGREVIAAGRQSDARSGTLSLRRSATVATIGADCRVVFLTGPETGAVGNIRSGVPSTDGVEFVVEMGVAT